MKTVKKVIILVLIVIVFSTIIAIVKTSNKKAIINNDIKIHYMDVGQGDSELIECGNEVMLIDTGTNESESALIGYLKSQKLKKINYLVLTHPHEDHIGGAAEVIENFDIGEIIMNKKSTNTKTYRAMINGIRQKKLKVKMPHLGDSFKLGGANCIVYGPVNPISDDLNTYSIVLKVTYGENKFLFTGDAQSSNENGMISNGYDLSADVLKVGHHGSRTSTSDEFLQAVNPKYAVISSGKGNDYGHPHEETMEKLKAKHINVYRTDENGTIICEGDGKSIKFNCSTGDYKSGENID